MRLLLAAVLGALALPAAAQTPSRPHNVVLFVADGLRAGMVNEKTAPAMTAPRRATPIRVPPNHQARLL